MPGATGTQRILNGRGQCGGQFRYHFSRRCLHLHPQLHLLSLRQLIHWWEWPRDLSPWKLLIMLPWQPTVFKFNLHVQNSVSRSNLFIAQNTVKQCVVWQSIYSTKYSVMLCMSHESFIALHGRGGKILTKLAAVDGVLGGMEGGVVDVGVTGEAPDRYVR